MPSKMEALRAGRAVEVNGSYWKLNPQTKSIETSEGKQIFVGNNPHYFPKSEADRKMSMETQKLQQEIKGHPLGETAGQFLYQAGQGSSIGRGVTDWWSRLTDTGEDYLAKRAAKANVSSQISKERPYLSMAGTATGFIPDLVATSGMSGAAAIPALTVAGAGSRVLDQPGEVAVEAALGSAGGFLVDKGASFLGRAAARRGLIRNVAREGAEVAALNLDRQAEVEAQNIIQKQKFSEAKSAYDLEVKANQHAFALQKVRRENEMISSKNAYEKAKAEHARVVKGIDDAYAKELSDYQAEVQRLSNEAAKAKAADAANAKALEREYMQQRAGFAAKKREIDAQSKQDKIDYSNELKRLKGEYDEAKKVYDESIASLPEQQKQAQKLVSQRASKYYDSISGEVPKDAIINSDSLGSFEFKESLRTGPYGSTQDGRQALRVADSLFKEGDVMTAEELARRLRVLDEIIETSPQETKILLDQLKRSIGKNAPTAISEAIIYSEGKSLVSGEVNKAIKQAFKEFKVDSNLRASKTALLEYAQHRATTAIEGMSQQEFVSKFQSGNLVRDIVDSSLDRTALAPRIQGAEKMPFARNIINEYEGLVSRLTDELEKTVEKIEQNVIPKASKTKRTVGRRFRETYGVAEPISPPEPPAPPGIPEAPGARPYPSEPIPPSYQTPTPPPMMPTKPSRPPYPEAPSAPVTPDVGAPPAPIEAPVAPAPIQFVPQAAPELPPASGAAEGLGQFLERPATSLIKGKGLADLGPVGNVLKLKYLLGGKALPVAAGYAALKGITSPTAIGAATREAMRKGSTMMLVDQIAGSYSSYNNGVLQDPTERRRATFEIESNPDIPLEDKAVIQAYINRGKSLEDLVRG